MDAEKTPKFGTTLLITIGFTLAVVELMSFVPYISNSFYLASVFLAFFLVFPITGGLICRDPRIAVYISTASVVSTFLLGNFFPLREIDKLGVVVSFAFAGFVLSAMTSFATYYSCVLIRELRTRMFRITKMNSLLLFSSIGLVVTTLVILTYSKSLFGYFEQHPWVVALVVGVAGIVTNALWFFLGRRRYGPKK